jgi:hypothetical protein
MYDNPLNGQVPIPRCRPVSFFTLNSSIKRTLPMTDADSFFIQYLTTKIFPKRTAAPRKQMFSENSRFR